MPIDPAVLADPERFMRQALEVAATSIEAGDLPIGALAIHDGEVIASAHNRRTIDADPLAHAELLAIAQAARNLGEWRLNEVTIVVTLEPCPMCAGAMWAARIGGVVYGAADLKAGAVGSLYNMGSDPRLNHEFDVRPRVFEQECAGILTKFFEARRGA
ncbi:MAG: tRNA adenosine(34) deaminase TadA [Microthrixaceae bacterium]|nr:tRNA adenosine(34) deaminase TadA [Microthrixaceae bacterium]